MKLSGVLIFTKDYIDEIIKIRLSEIRGKCVRFYFFAYEIINYIMQ